MTLSYDVAVLGAGPAGLIAAVRAATAGHSVIVLEKAPEVGGMARSLEVGGMCVDLGSRRLHSSIAPEIAAMLQQLLGDDLQLRERNGRMRFAGKWTRFPPSPVELALKLPLPISLSIIADGFTGLFSADSEEDFASSARARVGPTISDRFYLPYATKLWGLDPNLLDTEQADQRISTRSPGQLIGRVLAKRHRRTFLYPRLGFGEIVEALAEEVVKQGGDIKLRFGTVRAQPSAESVTLKAASGEIVEARTLFSTVPLPELIGMMANDVPLESVRAAKMLQHRSLVLAYLVLDQPSFSSFDTHYIPDLDVSFARLSEPKNYRTGPDPKDITVLCAEIPCSIGDRIWSMNNTSLRQLLISDVEKIGLPIPKVDSVVTHRLARAYPIYERGFSRRLEVVEDWIAAQPSLISFGRLGLFAYDNPHHAMEMGWAAAECLRSDSSIDKTRWGRHLREFAAISPKIEKITTAW